MLGRAGFLRLAFRYSAFYSEDFIVCLASIVMTDAVAPITGVPGIISFATADAETTTSRPSAERLLGGDPQHTARNYFSDTTGQFFAGVWESTVGRWRVEYTENEFCHITQGVVRIDSATGESWAFQAGDSFVIPAGFAGTWHVTQALRKLYVIFESASK